MVSPPECSGCGAAFAHVPSRCQARIWRTEPRGEFAYQVPGMPRMRKWATWGPGHRAVGTSAGGPGVSSAWLPPPARGWGAFGLRNTLHLALWSTSLLSTRGGGAKGYGVWEPSERRGCSLGFPRSAAHGPEAWPSLGWGPGPCSAPVGRVSLVISRTASWLLEVHHPTVISSTTAWNHPEGLRQTPPNT